MGPEGVIRSPSGLFCVGVGLFGAGPVNKMSLLLLALICWGAAPAPLTKRPCYVLVLVCWGPGTAPLTKCRCFCILIILLVAGAGPVSQTPLFCYAGYFVGGRGRGR